MSHTMQAADESFWRGLLEHIVTKGRWIPKFQVERAVGPIIGYFMEKDSRFLGGDMIVIGAEFPLKKQGDSNQSTNIDWLLYDRVNKELVFLELKTESSSFRNDQFDTYLSVAVENAPWERLMIDFNRICNVSLNDKYEKSKECVDNIARRYPELKQAKVRVVYLAPESTRMSFDKALEDFGSELSDSTIKIDFLSFTELHGSLVERPGVDESGYRDIFCSVLCELDKACAEAPGIDGVAVEGSSRNYEGVASFDEILLHCRGDRKILVGFAGGPSKLKLLNIADLHVRPFKWDWAGEANHGKTGDKSLRNWIEGSRFLALVEEIRSKHLRSEQDEKELQVDFGVALRTNPELRVGQMIARAWPDTAPWLEEVKDADLVKALLEKA